MDNLLYRAGGMYYAEGMILALIIGVVVVAGIFDSWTGLFGSLYSATKTIEPEQPKPAHRSFRLTKEG